MTTRHRVQVIPAPPLLPIPPPPDGYAHALILGEQAWVLGGQWLTEPDPYPPGQGPGPCGAYPGREGYVVGGSAPAGPDCTVTLPAPPAGHVWVLVAYNTNCQDFFGGEALIGTDPRNDWDAQLGGGSDGTGTGRAQTRLLGYAGSRTVKLTLRDLGNPTRPPRDPGEWVWIAAALPGALDFPAAGLSSAGTTTFTSSLSLLTRHRAGLSAATAVGPLTAAGACSPPDPALVPGFRHWYGTSPTTGSTGVSIRLDWWEHTPGTGTHNMAVQYTRPASPRQALLNTVRLETGSS